MYVGINQNLPEPANFKALYLLNYGRYGRYVLTLLLSLSMYLSLESREEYSIFMPFDKYSC